MTRRIALLPGDGIGPEVLGQAVRVLAALALDLHFVDAPVGAAAYRAFGHPLPPETVQVARDADAVLFGAVGDFTLDDLPRELRPEQAIAGLRRELGLFANLRPATVFSQIAHLSTLKPEVATGLDLLIIRDLDGPVDARFEAADGDRGRTAFDTFRADADRISRIARLAFDTARTRRGRVASVDKANLLETSRLWRTVVAEVAADYPDLALEHLYLDSAAVRLIRAPTEFDVILTGQMFGDFLSDQAAMLAGSVGLMPSASLGLEGPGVFEPVHGSAPDLAGRDVANPIGAILSAAMMLRYSLNEPEAANRVERAVVNALQAGARTPDLGGQASCTAVGNAVVAAMMH